MKEFMTARSLQACGLQFMEDVKICFQHLIRVSVCTLQPQSASTLQTPIQLETRLTRPDTRLFPSHVIRAIYILIALLQSYSHAMQTLSGKVEEPPTGAVFVSLTSVFSCHSYISDQLICLFSLSSRLNQLLVYHLLQLNHVQTCAV